MILTATYEQTGVERVSVEAYLVSVGELGLSEGCRGTRTCFSSGSSLPAQPQHDVTLGNNDAFAGPNVKLVHPSSKDVNVRFLESETCGSPFPPM